MENQGTPLIELKHITKIFPGVIALSDVSFDIYPGEVHALCGENGAGKSTLIKVMTGAHAADGGEYLIDGKPVQIHSTQEGIGYGVSCVYQELSIAQQLDVAKNLFLGNLPMKGKLVDHAELYSRAKDVLEELELPISPKTIAGDLSVGQQQMLEIGRALTRNARCIILDEPTSSLSEKETDTLFKIVNMLKGRGISIVYISHKLDEVMYLADRITVIRDGQNIITMNKADTTQDELITHMIGRPLEKQYPSKEGRSQGEVVLDVQNLCGGVFEDISFRVRAGEVLGFFGLVGAGRSEIMRAVFGVDAIRSGSVLMNGEPVRSHSTSAAIKAGMGFCTEDRKKEGLALRLSILLNQTIAKLDELSNGIGWINRRAQKEDAEGYVRALSTKTPSVNQLVGNLSGGNQQKVVLAKWLTKKPALLIMDEPTRGIDVGSKAEIYSIINDLAKEGVAIIVVSSEIEEIVGVCDSVITIFEGHKTAQLPITPALSNETVLACSIGKRDVIEAVNKGGAV